MFRYAASSKREIGDLSERRGQLAPGLDGATFQLLKQVEALYQVDDQMLAINNINFGAGQT
jgi:hypothetical protein